MVIAVVIPVNTFVRIVAAIIAPRTVVAVAMAISTLVRMALIVTAPRPIAR